MLEPKKDNQGQKGSSIRKMRKVSIILYVMLIIVMVFFVVYIFIKGGQIIDISRSSFLIFISIFLAISLVSDDSKKLSGNAPWYKSKWGWLSFILILAIIFAVITPLLAIYTLKNYRNNQEKRCLDYQNNILKTDNADDQLDIFYSTKLNTCISVYWAYESSEDGSHYITRHIIKDLFNENIIFYGTDLEGWNEKINELK